MAPRAAATVSAAVCTISPAASSSPAARYDATNFVTLPARPSSLIRAADAVASTTAHTPTWSIPSRPTR